MGKQVQGQDVAAYRREIGRLERESHRLHLEALRAAEAGAAAEKASKEAVHRLTQELSAQRFVNGELLRRVKALETTGQALTRRCEEQVAKLARADAAYRSRVAITEPLAPPMPTVLQYDASHRRVLPPPEAAPSDERLLETLQSVEDQRAGLQRRTEALEALCAQVTAENAGLKEKVAVREREMERWIERLEGRGGRSVEAIEAEHLEESNQLALRALQEQVQFLHSQLEQTDARLQRKGAELAALQDRYHAAAASVNALAPPPAPTAPAAPNPHQQPVPPAAPPGGQGPTLPPPLAPHSQSVPHPERRAEDTQRALLNDNLLRQLTEQVLEARAKEATLLEENRQLSLTGEATRRHAQHTASLLEEDRARLAEGLRQSHRELEARQGQWEAEVAAMAERLQAAEADRDEAAARAEELQQSLDVFNGEVDQFRVAFEVMIEKQQGLQGTLKDLEGRLADRQQRLEAALQEKAAAEGQLAAAEAELRAMAEERGAERATRQDEQRQALQGLASETHTERLNDDVRALREELRVRATELQEARAALADLDAQRDHLQLQTDAQRSTIRQLESARGDGAREHAQLLSLVTTLEAQAQQLSLQLRDRELQAGQEREAAQRLAVEAAQLAEEKEHLAASLREAAQDVANLQASYTLLSGQLEQANLDREGLKNDLQNALLKVIEGEREAHQRDQRLAEVVQAYDRLHDECAAGTAALQRTHREFQVAHHLAQSSEEALVASQATASAAEADIRTLVTDVAAIQHQNAALARQIAEYARTIEQLAQETDHLRTGLRSCEEVLQQREGEMLALRKDAALAHGEAAAVRQAAQELHDKCAGLESLLGHEQEKVTSLEELLKDLRLRECEASDTIGRQAADIQSLTHTVERLDLQRDQLVMREMDAFARMQESGTRQEELQRRCLVLELELQNQAALVARLQQRNAELQRKADAQSHLIQAMDPLFSA